MKYSNVLVLSIVFFLFLPLGMQAETTSDDTEEDVSIEQVVSSDLNCWTPDRGGTICDWAIEARDNVQTIDVDFEFQGTILGDDRTTFETLNQSYSGGSPTSVIEENQIQSNYRGMDRVVMTGTFETRSGVDTVSRIWSETD